MKAAWAILAAAIVGANPLIAQGQSCSEIAKNLKPKTIEEYQGPQCSRDDIKGDFQIRNEIAHLKLSKDAKMPDRSTIYCVPCKQGGTTRYVLINVAPPAVASPADAKWVIVTVSKQVFKDCPCKNKQ
jgi:hypothetical protein